MVEIALRNAGGLYPVAGVVASANWGVQDAAPVAAETATLGTPIEAIARAVASAPNACERRTKLHTYFPGRLP